MKEVVCEQVIGWSVHHPDEGICGPLYVDKSGKLYYLDCLDQRGFIPVKLGIHAVYKDE